MRFIDRHEINNKRERKLYGFILEKKNILSGFRGSIAHGLYMNPENADIYSTCDDDTFSLYAYPYEYYYSLEGYYRSGEVKETKHDNVDDVAYEIRKAFHLLKGCNPNVMTYLYNEKEDYFHISEAGQFLIDHRDMFLAKKRIHEAFSGYAYGQLSRLQKGAYRGYMGEKRRQIVDEHGYDTKNAMTLIRLLRNGRELLTEGIMKVKRTDDREELLAIKRGEYSLDDIHKMADEEFDKTNKAYEQSKLPEENSKFQINELLVDVINIVNNPPRKEEKV